MTLGDSWVEAGLKMTIITVFRKCVHAQGCHLSMLPPEPEKFTQWIVRYACENLGCSENHQVVVPREKYCVGCGYSQVSLRQNVTDAKCVLVLN